MAVLSVSRRNGANLTIIKAHITVTNVRTANVGDQLIVLFSLTALSVNDQYNFFDH